MTYIRTFGFAVCALALLSTFAPTSVSAACNATALGKTVYGSQNSAVSALQGCLIEAGYSIPAGATGYYGSQTRTAVQQFYQKALGMSWDGQSVGPVGRAKLAALVQQGGVGGAAAVKGYKKAGSAAELAKYVAESNNSAQSSFQNARTFTTGAEADSMSSPTAAPEPSRVSETTVQVAGVDEPDIVKTDGNTLYISKQAWYGRIMPMMDVRMGAPSSMPIWQDTSKTLLVDAYPLEELGLVSDDIEEKGEMLLVKDKKILVILAHPSLVAYDVSDPKKPVKKWTLTLENNTSLVTSRLTNGTLYLVTQTWINTGVPCPFTPVTRGSSKVIVACPDIWIPASIEPISNTYTVLAVDPATGVAAQKLAFGADGGATTVALFADNLYLATKSYGAPYKILMEATQNAYSAHVSTAAKNKMRTIMGYDISPAGALSEITQAAQNDLALRSADERMRIETEVQNTIQNELNLRKREMDRTRITRVPLANFSVAAVGEVPGSLLNQFSLDEYQGNLRVAVTVGSNWWGSGESANDVYVLGSDLTEKGSVKNLGLGERVYSVRFVGDTGYLVTFKQVDPFYVLDLSVPTAPKLAGELKIPGYSAYLEPLGNDLVLGVGREGNGVKLSVFDVSNPAKPLEKSKYIIKDSWTEVEGNHHAFLRDADHGVFFIPGGNGGYVFSYEKGKLTLKATVAGWSVKRAVYIDDNMYVIGDEKISVLDENTWKVVKELSL